MPVCARAHACTLVSSILVSSDLHSSSVPPTSKDFRALQDFFVQVVFPVHYNPHHLPGFRSPDSPGLLLDAIQDPQIKLLNQTSYPPPPRPASSY